LPREAQDRGSPRQAPGSVVIYDRLLGDIPHGWKFSMIGPNGKLNEPVGAPCNICELSAAYAQIVRFIANGGGPAPGAQHASGPVRSASPL